IDILEQGLDSFSTHPSVKIVTELFKSLEVLPIVEQLATLKRGHAGINDHEALEIEHPLDITQGHVQEHTDPFGQLLEEADLRQLADQLHSHHPLAANIVSC